MHSLINLALLLTFASAVPASNTADDFVASTPCGSTPRTFLNIASDVPCERITWQLMLSGSTSGTYTLRVRYGMTVPNTPDLRDGGTTAELRGEWFTAARGTPGASVISLAVPESAFALQLRRLDDNLLHLLDERGALLVGNGGWSYTLNRRSAKAASRSLGDLKPVARAADRDTGVFDGRSPCQTIAALLNARVTSDCAKLKWRLTLERDPTTGVPGQYRLEGTLYRDRPRTGRWSIERRATDATNVIIRLDRGEGALLSLLKGDDNVLLFLDEADRPLVGNADFSYTLNRASR